MGTPSASGVWCSSFTPNIFQTFAACLQPESQSQPKCFWIPWIATTWQLVLRNLKYYKTFAWWISRIWLVAESFSSQELILHQGLYCFFMELCSKGSLCLDSLWRDQQISTAHEVNQEMERDGPTISRKSLERDSQNDVEVNHFEIYVAQLQWWCLIQDESDVVWSL